MDEMPAYLSSPGGAQVGMCCAAKRIPACLSAPLLHPPELILSAAHLAPLLRVFPTWQGGDLGSHKSTHGPLYLHRRRTSITPNPNLGNLYTVAVRVLHSAF